MSDEPKYKFGGKYRTLADCMDHIHQQASKISDLQLRQSYIERLTQVFANAMTSEENRKAHERKKDNRTHVMQTVVAPIIGLLGLMVVVSLVLLNPFPSKFQSGVLWVILSLFAGAFAAMIPGFFKLNHLKVWQASGAIAVTIFIYVSTPKVMALDDFKVMHKLNISVARLDTTRIEPIAIDFDQNITRSFCDYTTNELNNYYGSTNKKADKFTYFRKSDGLIYSSQTCQEIKEKDVIAISNTVMYLFKDNRDAYLFFVKKLKK
jgi:hypothetical protein